MAGKIVIVDVEGAHSSDALERIRETLPDAEALCISPDGVSAESLCSHEPDVILIDVPSVGNEQAAALCRDLREEQAVRAPVVMVSAVLVSASDRIRAFEAGAHGMLSWPFNSRELLSELTMLMQLGVIAPDCMVSRGAGGDRIACDNLRFRLIFGHSPDAVVLADSLG